MTNRNQEFGPANRKQSQPDKCAKFARSIGKLFHTIPVNIISPTYLPLIERKTSLYLSSQPAILAIAIL
jgi:hypothetical protein